MAETENKSHPSYIAIFAWLFVLTVIEVALTYLPLGKVVLATLLVLTAVAKAFLVVMYFMHLRFERWIISFMVIFCLVLSAIFLLGLFPDIVMGDLFV